MTVNEAIEKLIEARNAGLGGCRLNVCSKIPGVHYHAEVDDVRVRTSSIVEHAKQDSSIVEIV